jgi:hypothetical protein
MLVPDYFYFSVTWNRKETLISSMLKIRLCIFTLFIFFQAAIAQTSLEGSVVSDDNKKPLPAASVYLNNTSIGTTTNEKGFFILRNIPSEKFRLVVSSIGYETYVVTVDPRKNLRELIIALKPKADQLSNVVAVPDQPDGWKKWGQLFTDVFIGTTPNSVQCHLENPEVLKFRMNPDNSLTAYAKEPLLIMNYALGYQIKYKLEEFEYDFNTKLVIYNGYTLFKDLGIDHPKQARKYEEERKDVYEGSLMHFMRTFFINKLDTSGFEMRNLGLVYNTEKQRAKLLFSQHRDSVILDTLAIEVEDPTYPDGKPKPYVRKAYKTADSSAYFKEKLSEPDSIISHQLIEADSIGFAADSSTAGFYFKDSLEVSYKLKGIPNKYKALIKMHKHETHPVSQFVFIHQKPVYISGNGYYFGPYDLKITGYWARSETIANLLPYDYKPGRPIP